MDYTLAIDQGTHASRALLLDDCGRTVASHLVAVDLRRPQPRYAEQDGDQIHASVTAAIDAILKPLSAARRRAVAQCGLSTQRSTVVAWQTGGALRSSLLSWQDTRGAQQIAHLAANEKHIRSISGLPLSPHYGASKLHWLYQLLGHSPGLRLGPLASFLLERLTGQSDSGTDHTNAQRMQLFDIHHLDWSEQLCECFGVPVDMLPACRPVFDDYGLLAPFAIPVTAVCGDQNVARLANGNPAATTAHINIGSGAFILVSRVDSEAPAGLLTSIGYSDAGRCDYLIEGTVNGAGSALQWLQEQGRASDIPAHLEGWCRQVEAPPIFMNAVGGLGSPWWCHSIEPRFVPAADHHSQAQLAVAVVESILFLLQHNLDRIQRQQSVLEIRISGGLSRVSALCQKLADLSGLPVIRSSDQEASARGVAWLAAGQPQAWILSDEDAQRFQPQANSGLKQRYAAFTEIIEHAVEAAHE